MATTSSVNTTVRNSPPESAIEAKVWDIPTRIFHWSIVALVAIAWASGEEEGTAFIIHSVAGYALITALIFRFAWGFVGGTHARFSDFLQPWSVVASYAKQLAKLKPARFVGHNPLGGWMVVLLLAVLTLMVVSGLFAQGDENLAGPWAANAIGLSSHDWYEVHEASFNVLLVLIVVHVAGVVADQFLTGDKLVRAMFTGNKRIAQSEQVAPAAQAGVAKALGVLAIAVIATGFIVGWQIPTSTGGHAGTEEHGEGAENSNRDD
ncbi:MAG: cytochrome b/b6 domain-containing protein [Burkholderiales bacterium]